MKKIILKIFPKTVDGNYTGYKISVWIFMCLALISTVRSCIHIFAADGGANSIATLDLTYGAENIIFAFALWGLSQLIYAIIQLLVAFRYKTLIPFMYVILIIETIGRMAIGYTKTPIYAQTPPGAIGNYIILPLAIAMLICSVWDVKNNK